MRLLFVSHRRDVSGGEICTQRIIERLKEHAVLVILPEGTFSKQLRDAGIDIKIENALGSMTRSEDRYAFLKLANRLPGLVMRLGRTMRDFKADLVISNALGPLPYAGPAARLARVPNICIHFHPVLRPGSADAKLVFLLSKFCDGFIAVSDAMNYGLQASGVPAARVQTIYNGLNLDFYRPASTPTNFLRTKFNLPPETKLIGLVGTIFEAKGHHVVIEAARILRDESSIDSPWRVVFIGDVFENSKAGADYKSRLNQQIESGHLEGKIIFAGKLGNMRDVYPELDIVLNASIEPEPLGTTIYEAMAMSRPVIATNLGGSSEIIRNGKCGFLVPADDSRELAIILAKILREEIDLEPILIAARQRVEEAFDIRETAQRYTAFFKSYAKRS